MEELDSLDVLIYQGLEEVVKHKAFVDIAKQIRKKTVNKYLCQSDFDDLVRNMMVTERARLDVKAAYSLYEIEKKEFKDEFWQVSFVCSWRQLIRVIEHYKSYKKKHKYLTKVIQDGH